MDVDNPFIRCVDLEWINGPADDPQDLCAHSTVSFAAGEVEFVAPGEGSWTVSGTALYLLRTLEFNHEADSSVTEGNQLFPCCAFHPAAQEGEFGSFFVGQCPNGMNVWITHDGDDVALESDRGRAQVTFAAWRTAVFAFADQVRAFYDRSQPKVPAEDDDIRLGWSAFWKEWQHRR